MGEELEQWIAVERDDRYEVSNLGRARSWAVTGHPLLRSDSPKILALHPDLKGYMSFGVAHRTARIHVEVLLAFVGPRPEGMVACHYPLKDKTNNKLDNLKWGTPEENRFHRVEQGSNLVELTTTAGEMFPHAKLSKEKVSEAILWYKPEVKGIANRRKLGLPTIDMVAKRYGVSRETMGMAIRGDTWVSEVGKTPASKSAVKR